jgi:predicted metal-binding membrane protein
MIMPIGFSRGLTLSVLVLAAAAWVLLFGTGSGMHGHNLHGSETASETTYSDQSRAGQAPPRLASPERSGTANHQHGAVAVPGGPSVPVGGPVASPTSPVTAAVLFGWVLMVVAMMLPPALPILDLLRKLVARQRYPRLLIGLGAAGFVGVWAAAGVLLIVSDAAVRGFADQIRWIADFDRGHPQVVAGAVLVMAGLYQFTPMKTACLRACRSPRGFAVAHWRGARPAWLEATTVTGAYAASCVGCCWALMAVTFVVGVAALPVMVVLAVLMAAERLARRGRRLVRPIGVATVSLGVLALFELLPTGLLAA